MTSLSFPSVRPSSNPNAGRAHDPAVASDAPTSTRTLAEFWDEVLQRLKLALEDQDRRAE